MRGERYIYRLEKRKERGKDRERNGKRNSGKVGRDKGRNDGGRGGRLKSVCWCHYNHSVIISCYGNKTFFHSSGSRPAQGFCQH